MAEHVMDTSVLQALLAAAWDDGKSAGKYEAWLEGNNLLTDHARTNPYWAPVPAVSEEDLERINSLLAGNSEDS